MNTDATAARRRPIRWAVLLAVAVVVATGVGLAVTIGGSPGAPHSAGPALLASSGPEVTVRLDTAPAFDGGAVPAYYVAVDDGSAQVRATGTGAVLATIRTPARSAGYLAGIASTVGDRTFVLTAGRSTPLTLLYLLRLDPQAGMARLSPLPITVATPSALQFAGLALSPDGTKLAVAVNDWAPNRLRGPRVWVYDLAAGSRREWVWPGSALMTSAAAKGQASLSWTANE